MVLALTDVPADGSIAVNVCGSRASVRDVAAMVTEVAAGPHGPLLGGGQRAQPALELDMSKASELVGYEPRYSLRDGVRRYADALINRTDTQETR